MLFAPRVMNVSGLASLHADIWWIYDSHFIELTDITVDLGLLN